MQRIVHKEDQAGFAVLELALIVVVLVVIAGAGVFFVHNRQNNSSTTATEANTTVPKAQPGTTAAIDQLTQRDAESEASIDKSADGQAQQDTTSANSDLTSLGGAYNEANF